MLNNENFLRPAEVARRLQVSTRHVHDLIAKRLIPYVEISPRCRRIPLAEFEQFLATRFEPAAK